MPAETKEFKKFASALLARYHLGAPLLEVVRLLTDAEVRVQHLMPWFEQNPFYEHSLFKLPMIQERIKAWFQEEETNPRRLEVVLERILGLLGKHAVRNFILALRLVRISGGPLPRKKGEAFALNTGDLLKYSLKVEEFFMDKNWPGAQDAFLAGYHFDLLTAILTQQKATKETLALVEKSFEEAFRSAKLATALGSKVKGLKHQRWVFPAALCAHLGRVGMHLCFPKEGGGRSWLGTLNAYEKAGPRAAMTFGLVEYPRFSLTSGVLSAALVSSMGLFPSAVKSLLGLHTPETLKGPKLRDDFLLAGITRIAERGRFFGKELKPPFGDKATLRMLGELNLSLDATKTAWEPFYDGKK